MKIIDQIRKQSITARIFLFITILVVWFYFTSDYNSSINDAVEKASSRKTIWLISTLLIAGLWIVFFPSKKK